MVGKIEFRDIEEELTTTMVYMLAYGYNPKVIKQYRQYVDNEWSEWKNL